MQDPHSRYHRQTLLPAIGKDGQRRLAKASALVMGCGALGAFAAELLARAGVGRLIIVDRDIVELTNLQRQVLFDERDAAAGLPKAEAARRRLAHVNAEVDVAAIVDDLNPATIARIARGADVLVDGLDNFETRFLANDFAVKHGLPYVYGGAIGTAGMAFPVVPTHGGACLRCLF
ncbi:MAG: HesA/MoeB/ThiF family protein, partial [Pseudomonadota bacterium]